MQENSIHWQPTASLSALQKRAAILKIIRTFFAERNVLEVETPLLSHGTVTDPYVRGIPATYQSHAHAEPRTLYLQTSPEYAMKRLLAAGSGSIYQICKAFRQDDTGRLHNPEFTLLEWYRLGFDHHQLMDEMDALLQAVLETPRAERICYADAFQKHLGIDPHVISLKELQALTQQHVQLNAPIEEKDVLLDVLLTHCLEPHFGQSKPLFLYDFPASQAALAQIQEQPGESSLASRFEVYYKGIELANGFHELQHPVEQKNRFLKDLGYRARHHIPSVPMDERLLAALSHGLPDCSGVALGLDRLLMLALGYENMAEIISFGFAHA